jgi:hypothetical protein
MNLLKAYILFCLLCPVFNIEKEQKTEEQIEEVAFWCDCGAAIRCDEMMLSDG